MDLRHAEDNDSLQVVVDVKSNGRERYDIMSTWARDMHARITMDMMHKLIEATADKDGYADHNFVKSIVYTASDLADTYLVKMALDGHLVRAPDLTSHPAGTLTEGITSGKLAGDAVTGRFTDDQTPKPMKDNELKGHIESLWGAAFNKEIDWDSHITDGARDYNRALVMIYNKVWELRRDAVQNG